MKSALTEFLNDEEEESENDFLLKAPDRYTAGYIRCKFFIGGKEPLFVGPCDLSQNHNVKDVIKHVLTLYRRNK